MNSTMTTVRELRRNRPRDPFLRFSAAAFMLLVIFSWWWGRFSPAALFTPQRSTNLQRFLTELIPYPLQDKPFDFPAVLSWASSILDEKGRDAAVQTFSISVVAGVLAGLLGIILAPLAARNLVTAGAWSSLSGERAGILPRSLAVVVRVLLMFLRAIPEYVWAYVFLGLLGPSAWPAIFALALHNGGVIGKLCTDSIENLPQAPLRALRNLGASAGQVAVGGVWPLLLPRYLLYLFLRWEWAVRESTVLGLLGIASLGFWIQDARARNFYDEMVFFILLAAGLVLIGDVLSYLAREVIRRT